MEDQNWKVLLVDDDEDDYILIHHMLSEIRETDFRLEWVSTLNEAWRRLDEDEWDAVLVDYDMGTGNGMNFIRQAVEAGIRAPLIMVTGRGRYELDVEAMKSGAADYISKNMVNSAFLERVIRYAVERSRSKEVLERQVNQRTVELENAMEELRVAEEELRTQHEELLQINARMEEDCAFHTRAKNNFTVLELITDEKGTILEMNHQAEGLFHLFSPQAGESLLSLFIHIEDRRRFARWLAHLEEKPMTGRYELSVPHTFTGEWCVTVTAARPRRAGKEFYWLFHPVYDHHIPAG